MRSLLVSAAVMVTTLISGCSLMPSTETVPVEETASLQEPTFSPYPFALKRSINVQRELKIQSGKLAFSGQAAFFADNRSVRLTVSQNGQTIWSIYYNGETIHEERSSEVPSQLQAKQLLRDFGLAYWPVQAVQSQLKTWAIQTGSNSRLVTDQAGNPVLNVTYASDPAKAADSGFILENLSAGYRLSF